MGVAVGLNSALRKYWYSQLVLGAGPFVMGGEVGNPKDGYRVRCRTKPTVIVLEKFAGRDGKRGSMAMCDHCYAVFCEQEDPSMVVVMSILEGDDG